MKKVKKLMALLLTVIMVMGMSVTATAADAENTETATLTINGITGNATVTLYQIAKGVYSGEPDGSTFTGFEYAEGVKKADIEGQNLPTSQTINSIAQGLLVNTISPIGNKEETSVKALEGQTATFTKEVSQAGIWIAIITNASDHKVYNPIFLAASYDQDSALNNGSDVNVTNKYLYGNTAVAKSSEPTVDKDITNGTTTDGDRDTASVGDRIQYTVDVTMPSYPQNATNKTLFLKDEMSAGLSFEYDSLNISLKNGNDIIPATRTGNDGVYTYTANGEPIAEATKQDNGFYMNFDYDKLYIDNTGAVYTPQVTYSAVVTDDAVVGNAGNANTATLEYSNNPNQGDTWDDSSKDPSEDPGFGVVSKEDTETVYTYQIAFKKSTEDENKPLAGAVFGVYTDEECKNLIDIVKTNKDGIAVSTKVEAGDYWVKELHAPDGYTLNETAYKITANQKSATKTVTGITRTYTSEILEALDGDNAVQVGWLKDGEFYSMDAFTEADETAGTVQKAYLKSETENVSTETSLDKTDDNNGTAVLTGTIKNTKMASLPSTGGIGTTIFTVAGCLIMIAAVGLFFASRKKR